ncbi:MAG: c-type cytochrome [Gammaproteobacteria bacterium]|jgi:putative heme-binding domain-containing protein|nr:c-type cytochrome [Gammaproteobacteria bacterium]MBT3860791.1 c-type cytochrome [Gammaproteobacteria bacterium]MBT3986954.1 c-type cytochrome [Gammaproteobacteria bacterium]MBT4582065.1 c-type cytochrome [Gammaproteobacteria bacterium]MBT4658716.1 c-type cytochrome [Gammaproteobacteria bacterium]
MKLYNKKKKIHKPLFIKVIFSIFLLLSVGLSSSAFAQRNNPLEFDPRAPQAGGLIFRAQCATCHGADARGISTIDAPDLTLIWTRSETTDSSVFDIIQQGVSGSIMPPHGFPDTEIWMLVSYLRSVAVGGSVEAFEGNSNRGQQLFTENCSQCHRAQGFGGSLGPSLNSITSRRTQSSLKNSVRAPSSAISRRFKPIEIVTSAGESVTGILKGEDAFSIQIMDSYQQLRAFEKNGITNVRRDLPSLMPVFDQASLSDSELDDILSFLNLSR